MNETLTTWRAVKVPDSGSEGWGFEACLLGFWIIALDKLLTPRSSLFTKLYKLVTTWSMTGWEWDKYVAW